MGAHLYSVTKLINRPLLSVLGKGYCGIEPCFPLSFWSTTCTWLVGEWRKCGSGRRGIRYSGWTQIIWVRVFSDTCEYKILTHHFPDPNSASFCADRFLPTRCQVPNIQVTLLCVLGVNWIFPKNGSMQRSARCNLVIWDVCRTLQHTATHCNTLQHIATHAKYRRSSCINLLRTIDFTICIYVHI